MKTTIISILIMLASTFTSLAGNYESAMKKNIDQMYASQSESNLNDIASSFYRIAEAEKNKWLPYYYAGYSYVSITFNVEDAGVIDKYLDKAQEMINKAMEIDPKESELYVLQGLIHSMRITSPMRGMKYSGLSNEALEEAKKLNSGNPRVWFNLAQNVYHTPSMFGGGEEKALPLFEKAGVLFDTFEPPHELWPMWGREKNAEMIAEIINNRK